MRDIKDIIYEIEIWKGAANISYEPLNGGLSNCTYKVTVDTTPYVLRINGEQNTFLNLKREDEIDMLYKAHELGIAPKVFLTENKSEYIITEYKQGHIINCDEIHNPNLIKKIAESLVKVHKLIKPSRECSPFYLIDKYLKGCTALNVKIPDDLTELLRKVNKIEAQCVRNFKYVIKYCHNDFYALNIINNNMDLTIIDWELSGVSDIFFDLAAISFSNAFSKEEDELLLKSYFGYSDDEHKILLHNMKYMNMLREITWSLMHSGINVKRVNHDHDYYRNAMWFIDRMKQGYVTV